MACSGAEQLGAVAPAPEPRRSDAASPWALECCQPLEQLQVVLAARSGVPARGISEQGLPT